MFWGKSTTVTHTSLSEKKNRILGVFTSMQNELQELHDEQQAYAQTIQAQLKGLSEELTAVETSRGETIKTLGKINNILK